MLARRAVLGVYYADCVRVLLIDPWMIVDINLTSEGLDEHIAGLDRATKCLLAMQLNALQSRFALDCSLLQALFIVRLSKIIVEILDAHTCERLIFFLI